jgi:hypothetical protein
VAAAVAGTRADRRGFGRSLNLGPVTLTNVLAMRSAKVREYPDSPGLHVVYTREDILGTLIWTQVSFFSEDSGVTIAHIASTTNPSNGVADFGAMARSFRFGT